MLFKVAFRKSRLEITISEKMKRFVLAVMEKEQNIDFAPSTARTCQQVFRKPRREIEKELLELGFAIYPYSITNYEGTVNIGILFLKGAEETIEIEIRSTAEVGRMFYVYRKNYRKFKKLEAYIDKKLAELENSASTTL